MKQLLGILVISLLWCNVVYALNFQELEKYIEKNTGTVSAIYMFERCSALTHFMYLKLQKEGSPAAPKNKNFSDEFFLFAEIFYIKHHNVSENIARKKVLESIKRMIQLYEEDAEEMYNKNGLYLSGIILSDYNFCLILYGKTKSKLN